MLFTLIKISANIRNNTFTCPPIFPNEYGYSGEDVYDVLHWAEYQCSLYNEKTGRTKIPYIAHPSYFIKDAKIFLGHKAVSRLGLPPKRHYKMPVYNIRFIKTEVGSAFSRNRGIFFGIVISNGEWASVSSEHVQQSTPFSEIEWSNSSVLGYKRDYNFPENPYFPKKTSVSESGKSAIDPNKTVSDEISSSIEKIRKAISGFGESLTDVTEILGGLSTPSRPHIVAPSAEATPPVERDFYRFPVDWSLPPLPISDPGIRTDRWDVLDEPTSQEQEDVLRQRIVDWGTRNWHTDFPISYGRGIFNAATNANFTVDNPLEELESDDKEE